VNTDGGRRDDPPFTIGRSRPGDHLVHVVEAPGEAETVAASYLAGALERGFAALWLHARGEEARCAEALSAAGVDVAAASARDDLALEPADAFFFEAGRFAPARAAAALAARIAAARGTGHPALFVATDLGGARAASTEEIVRWEAGIGAPTHASALCQLDRRRFPAELVRSMIRLHPLVVHRGRTMRNPEVLTADAALAREAPEDEVNRLLATLRERALAEEALRRSERLHRLFAENAADLIHRYRLAPAPGFEYVSPACVAMIGYTPEEHYADPELGHRLVHPDDLPKLQAALEGTGDPITMRWLHKDGRVVWIEQRNVLVRDAAGRSIAIEGVGRDVTERVRAEELLRESEERLRFALECAGHAYWEFSVGGGETTGRWWRVLGWEDGEIAPTRDGWRALVHPDDLPCVDGALEAYLQGNAPSYRAEYRARAKGGGWRWILGSGRRRPTRPGEPARMAGTLTDVTEPHQLAERARASERLASIGTLAGGLAHEVNNPLAGVVSSLGHVREELASVAAAPGAAAARLPALSAAVDDALEAAGRVGSIVRGLQQFATPGRRSGPTRVDLRAELLAAVGITRNELSHRARLALEIPEALPDVIAHPGELGQVFVNLLVNAAQAVREGAPGEIRVAARAEGGQVTVEIADAGVGMAPEVLARAVEPFFTTRPIGSGSGLGLSIAHGIVTAAGGRLGLDSAPARGTRVTVSLPAAPPAVTPAATPAPAAPQGGAARPTVLVVDDEPLVGRSLARLLRSSHDVTLLDSAAEAHRRLAAGERWDAILCDLMMPGLSGMDLEERLRTDAPDTVARIVYMTGGAFTEHARTFLAEGRPWVEKPVEPSTLRDAVAERVAAGRARSRET